MEKPFRSLRHFSGRQPRIQMLMLFDFSLLYFLQFFNQTFEGISIVLHAKREYLILL